MNTLPPRDSRGRFTKSNGYSDGESMLLEELVGNALLSRDALFRNYLDPRRDIDDEVGYPKTDELTSRIYRVLYDREAIAARVVDVLPDESWMTYPTIFETERPDEETKFEKAWKDLTSELNGGSHFRGEEGSPIWEYLQRLDRLSGIGRFGVLLVGLDDGQDLEREPQARSGASLLFLRPFDESAVEIARFESDVNNPRFGHPTQYSIELGEPNSESSSRFVETQSSSGSKKVKVHWKRVIHVADNLGNSEVFGIPRMRSVYNRIWDLRKLYAGSAEMYWRGAFPGLSIETNPRLGPNVQVDRSEMRSMMEKYMTGLQRYLTLVGMNAKSLAPQVVDPSKQIEVQLDAIAVKIGVPKRIFKGSERGELASSQDDAMFNDRLRARQNGYLSPRVIAPFVDRLINLGVLPKPSQGFRISWPDLESLTDDERAQVAERRSRAMMSYTTGGVSAIMEPIDFLTRELGYTKGEAESILENVQDSLEEERERLPVPIPSSEDEEQDEEQEDTDPVAAQA